ncbi:MAG: hypothetical protein UZ13_00070 [Chloroflexi bacterium OLB13]|nr:MAG: hypothetical protein UZ13_00070 [Chloroflexi bacterium OLB13]
MIGEGHSSATKPRAAAPYDGGLVKMEKWLALGRERDL